MVGDDLGGPLATAAQRPVMIVQARLAPSRFRMTEQENQLHDPTPENPFETTV
jgi:hypothetical protein